MSTTTESAPLISVFTPSHDARYLDDCYASLAAQTYQNWEWVVVLNHGAVWAAQPATDLRVHVDRCDQLRGVGAAKSYAVERCSGSLLVELDHDDILSSDALEQLVTAHAENPGYGLFFSDCAQVTEDLGYDASRFDETCGWEYRDVEVDERKVLALTALEPSPHNISFIWWAPNHFRAFTSDAYDAAGGYDPDREVCDDLDLMCRLFTVTDFWHIPEVLYLQRMHDGNTQRDLDRNQQIQRECVELHDRHIEAMSLAWARRHGLEALDLGGAHNSPAGWTAVDRLPSPAGPVGGLYRWGEIFEVLGGMADGSVGAVRAVDFLEHVPDKVRLMNEIWRVLVHGGMLISETPSTDGRGAFQDPTHCAFWNENSFWYHTDKDYARFVPEIVSRFQVSRLESWFPSEFHRANSIPYVKAHLVALHDGARQGGWVKW